MNKLDAKQMKEVAKKAIADKVENQNQLIKKAFDIIYEQMFSHIRNNGVYKFSIEFLEPVDGSFDQCPRLKVSNDETIDIPIGSVVKEFEKLGYLVSCSRATTGNGYVKTMTILLL